MTSNNVVPAIEVEGLRKVYKRLIAVDNVSFVMYRGEAFGFLVVGCPLADKSAVAAINRALRGCRIRSRYSGYFVKKHNRALQMSG